MNIARKILLLAALALVALVAMFARPSTRDLPETSRANDAAAVVAAEETGPDTDADTSVDAPSEQDVSELRPVSRDTSWLLPEYIHGGQPGKAYRRGGVIYWFMLQNNTGTMIVNPGETEWPDVYDQGPYEFVGVLRSADEGKTWERYLRVPAYGTDEYAIRANPVGMFARGSTFIVDFADDQGAGSGEGQFLRYESSDHLRWKKTSCEYFVPEAYDADPLHYPSNAKTVPGFACVAAIPETLPQ